MEDVSKLNDVFLLLARFLIGVVLIAHGWQKFDEWTLAGTAEAFASMGVPAPGLAGTAAAVVELVGGILIVLGAFTTWVGAIVALQMFVAYLFAHAGKGVFVDNGGFELVASIGAAALAIAAAGAGRFSIDRLMRR